MKKKTKTPKEENVTNILKKVAKRIEEATIDIHEMKSDLKFVSLRLSNVEHNTKVMKVDIEKLKENTDDLIETTKEILANMVTRKEHEDLSERVSTLEQ